MSRNRLGPLKINGFFGSFLAFLAGGGAILRLDCCKNQLDKKVTLDEACLAQ